MNEKITQAFIDALIAKVPPDQRLIDYRSPHRLEEFLMGGQVREMLEGEVFTGEYCILESIPLTGKAWAEVNLVNRIGSVFLLNDDMWHVAYQEEYQAICIMKAIRYKTDLYTYYSLSHWDDWPGELDGLSDKNVTWLYKAEIREKKENENE